jgi:hypothetical protein
MVGGEGGVLGYAVVTCGHLGGARKSCCLQFFSGKRRERIGISFQLKLLSKNNKLENQGITRFKSPSAAFLLSCSYILASSSCLQKSSQSMTA